MFRTAITLLLMIEASLPLRAQTLSDDPKLPTSFVNAVPDICFNTARGRPLTKDNAATLLIEPTTELPPTVKDHFKAVPSWFRLKAHPANIFIGVGDRPNACHVILANTTLVTQVQTMVAGVLVAAGFKIIQGDKPAAFVDMMFAKEAPDGYMVVSLQGPRGPMRNGDGDQGGVHVGLIPKAMFEQLIEKR